MMPFQFRNEINAMLRRAMVPEIVIARPVVDIVAYLLQELDTARATIKRLKEKQNW
jgi:hypothetical protein